MPYDFMMMQRNAGHESRLVTVFGNTLDFPEDISLGIRLPAGKTAKKWRDSKIEGLKYCEPENFAEKIYFKFRDFRNKGLIESVIDKYGLTDFDIYHFDGGMDLYRDLSFAKEMRNAGKKIVCCYYGSDLRVRGMFRELDEMSSLNLTVEFDHTSLHKNIHYLFFPFNVFSHEYRYTENEKLRIIHSPTNRLYKGTDKILKIIEGLKSKHDFELILAEHMHRDELLKLKRTCDLAIDQVGGESGGSGYGKNSIENLAMGIPTITEFYDEYLEFLPENPFITCNIDSLKDKLTELLCNRSTLKNYSEKGRAWAEKYHSFESVNRRVEQLYSENGI